MRGVPTNVYDETFANSGNIFYGQSLSTAVDYQNGVASTNKSINIRANRETGTFGASDPTCGHTYVRIKSDAEFT